MEIWDVYDENRKPQGRGHVRGVPLAPGDFHIVVFVWIRNSQGLFLCSKRHPDKIGWPGCWECTGGSAVAGEDSLSAAVREVREELGIVLDPNNGVLIHTVKGDSHFADYWLFEQDVDLADIVLQEGETSDAKWATAAEIIEMSETGVFSHNLDYFVSKFINGGAHE